LSTSFGRRPVYIVSQLICFGSSIWRAKATTYNSFMGACILNGIGAGPAETIQPAVIADIFFLHDRGFWNTLYWVCHLQRNPVASFVTMRYWTHETIYERSCPFARIRVYNLSGHCGAHGDPVRDMIIMKTC